MKNLKNCDSFSKVIVSPAIHSRGFGSKILIFNLFYPVILNEVKNLNNFTF